MFHKYPIWASDCIVIQEKNQNNVTNNEIFIKRSNKNKYYKTKKEKHKKKKKKGNGKK